MYVHLVHAYGYGIMSMSMVVSVMIVIVIIKKTKGRLPDVPICVNIMVLNRL